MSNKYETWKKRAASHDVLHDPSKLNIRAINDPSCKVCYPMIQTNRKFMRFWEWYGKVIPESKEYTSNTEERFSELLIIKDEENKETIKKVGQMISTIRYSDKPKLTEKEIWTHIMTRIIASDSFEKTNEETERVLEDLIVNSESEREWTSDPEKDLDVSDGWYEGLVMKIKKHERYHRGENVEEIYKIDYSCQRCYPVKNSQEKELIEFWKWYKKITNAESFSEKTMETLKELRKIDFETVDSRKEENFKLVLLLIDTMRYTNKPKLNRNKIMGKIIAILAISSNFKIGLKEAQEKYRRAKSREEEKQGILSGYTTQENSPENNLSPKKIESPKNEEKEMFIEEVINELEKESIESERITIWCGKYGPYEITGEGEGYEIIFNKEERNPISKEELTRYCEENGLDDTIILEEIEGYIELIREKDKKDKGKRSLEQTFRMIEENLERELNNEERNFIRIMMNKNITDEEILEEFLQWLRPEETIQNKGSDDESYDEQTEIIINTPKNSLSPKQVPTESENLTEEESESNKSTTTEDSNIVTMALNIIQIRKFSGENDEDPQEWLKEFIRGAVANNWGNDGNDDALTKYAAAHLIGEAALWFEEQKTDAATSIDHWKQNGNADRNFVERFLRKFNSDDKQIRFQEELLQMRQIPGESVRTYANRFQRIAKRTGDNTPELFKARLFTNGLIHDVYKFANILEANTLLNAIKNAEKAERSIQGKKPDIETPEKYKIDNRIHDYTNPNNKIYKKMQEPEDSIDDLVKAMEKKLEIRMLEVLNKNNNNQNNGRNQNFNRNRNNNNRNNGMKNKITCYNCGKTGHYANECTKKDVTCYGCNERGHYANECPNKKENSRENQGRDRKNKGNQRNVNYIKTLSKETEEDDFEMNDNEREIFLERTRSGRPIKRLRFEDENREDEDENMEDVVTTKNKKQNNIERMQNARRAKWVCSRCAKTGHFGTECPKLKCSRCDQQGHSYDKCPTVNVPRVKKSKRKNPTSVMEKIEENIRGLNAQGILERVLNEKCFSIAETMKFAPNLKKELREAIKKYNDEGKIKYINAEDKSKYTPIKCVSNIEGIKVETIIDTGAGISAITRGLMEKLQWEEDEESDLILVTADNTKHNSLGRMREIYFLIEGKKVSANGIEIIESPEKLLILGTDWAHKKEGKIDLKNNILEIESEEGNVKIPVEFIQRIEIEEDNDSEEDED